MWATACLAIYHDRCIGGHIERLSRNTGKKVKAFACLWCGLQTKIRKSWLSCTHRVQRADPSSPMGDGPTGDDLFTVVTAADVRGGLLVGCALCSTECIARELKYHEEGTHTSEAFRCQICRATFQNSNGFRKHSRLNGHQILVVFRTSADQEYEDRSRRVQNPLLGIDGEVGSFSPEARARIKALADRDTRVDFYTLEGEQPGVSCIGPFPHHDLSFPPYYLVEDAFREIWSRWATSDERAATGHICVALG